MFSALRAGLNASRYWRRSGGRDHILLASSPRAMEALFGDTWHVVAPAILLKV